jgi:hypothetical protein
MPSIAILTSTSPLRKTSAQGGVTKQRLNIDICVQLADKFDVVIVGSAAPDDVFDHISRNLPRSVRIKFRFYARSFFSTQPKRDATDDGRHAGWEAILAENRVAFEPLLTRVRPDRRSEQVKFNWQQMEDFVTDKNVTFVSGSEGQLLYSFPKKHSKG